MKIYNTLTPAMRRKLKRVLDSGMRTPEEIRDNMREQFFIEHQDELIPLLEANEKIRRSNEENGTDIPYIPVVTRPHAVNGSFEHTMEYEIECFIQQWEKKHEV